MTKNISDVKNQKTKYILLLILLFACLVAVLACLGKYVGDYLAYKNSWQAHASFEFEKLEDEVDENGNTVACYGVSTPAQLIGAIMQSSNGSASQKSEQEADGEVSSETNPQSTAKWDDYVSSSDSVTYKLTSDIDFDSIEYEWTKLDFGRYLNQNYILDGCGYTIKNITIKHTTQPAFINGNYGTIKNLNFENIRVECTNKNLTTSAWGASICCSNYNTIRCCNIKSGYVDTYSAAGIAGYNDGVIENCNNYANITGNNGAGMSGGIVYQNSGIINGCNNYGKITSIIYAGGIAADTRCQIIDCNNYGDVICKNNTSDHISGSPTSGGIAGGMRDDSSINNEDVIITNCVNYGKVYNINSLNAYSTATGGIVGELLADGDKNLKIELCVSLGDVSVVNNSSFFTYVGGIVGGLGISLNNEVSTVEIEKCCNAAVLLSESQKKCYSGGILGMGASPLNNENLCCKIKINNCFNTGMIKYKSVEGATNDLFNQRGIYFAKETQRGGSTVQNTYSQLTAAGGYQYVQDIKHDLTLSDITDYSEKKKYQYITNITNYYRYGDMYLGGLVGNAGKNLECTNSYSTASFDYNNTTQGDRFEFDTKDRFVYSGSAFPKKTETFLHGNAKFAGTLTVDSHFVVYYKPVGINLIYGSGTPNLNNVYSTKTYNQVKSGFNNSKIIATSNNNITNYSKGPYWSVTQTSNGPTNASVVYQFEVDSYVVNKLDLKYGSCKASIGDDSYSLVISYDLYCGTSGSTRCGSKEGDFGLKIELGLENDYYIGAGNTNVIERAPTVEDLGADVWVSFPGVNDGLPILKDFYWIYA